METFPILFNRLAKSRRRSVLDFRLPQAVGKHLNPKTLHHSN